MAKIKMIREEDGTFTLTISELQNISADRKKIIAMMDGLEDHREYISADNLYESMMKSGFYPSPAIPPEMDREPCNPCRYDMCFCGEYDCGYNHE